MRLSAILGASFVFCLQLAQAASLPRLAFPPATPTAVVATLTIDLASTETVSPTLMVLDHYGQTIGADFILEEPITGVSINPLVQSTWPALNSSLRPSTSRRFVFLRAIRDTPTFFPGYLDPDAGGIRPRTEGLSLFAWQPGKRYETSGMFVRSPYALQKPLVNVSDIPHGAVIVCPYTKKPFTLL